MNDIFTIIFSNIINILLLIAIIYRIYRYFYGPKEKKSSPISGIGKIFAVISILIIGGMVTCGGNFLLGYSSIFGGGGGQGFFNAFLFWLFELGLVLIYAIWKVYFRISIPNGEYPLQDTLIKEKIIELVPMASSELMTSLSQVDISNIASITFLPSNGKGFTIKTPNIKKLVVYITTKLKKNIFTAEELRQAFDHVTMNISSDLSKTDFNLIQGKISEFVKSGGEVKIDTK